MDPMVVMNVGIRESVTDPYVGSLNEQQQRVCLPTAIVEADRVPLFPSCPVCDQEDGEPEEVVVN